MAKPEEMRPLARPSRRREDNKVNLTEIWQNVGLIHLTQNREHSSREHDNEHSGSIKYRVLLDS
jgi:hypothetical protein